jgi:hypothetical protein
MDLGDSAAFQTDAGTRVITPRQGYPLYFALMQAATAAVPGNPARAANLLSVVCGALAAGVLTLLVNRLTRSIVAAMFAGLLFAGSYTFWSQSVTAEVYALHIVFISLTLIAFHGWAAKPSPARLAVAFAVYAVGFGNHLSMILLAPALVWFMALAHPRGWRGLYARDTIVLAVAIATLGATQYLWNLAGMLAQPDVPTVGELFPAFWFDVTKTDWRETMMLGTPPVMYSDRLAMYMFDLRQQFGAAGIVLAALGMVSLARRSRRDGVLVGMVFAVNWLFAFTYNVGDIHVFFLPSHLMLAVAAGCSVAVVEAWMPRRVAAVAVAVAALPYPAWRIYDTWPAVDRSRDRRAEQVLATLTRDLAPDRAILAADFNWQLQNGLSYFGAHEKPDLQYFRTADRLFGFPLLVDANADRQIFLSTEAQRRIASAFGSLYTIDMDVGAERLAEAARDLPAGTAYVLCVLTPYRDRPIESASLDELLATLGASSVGAPSQDGYSVIAGVKGTAPQLFRSTARPFRTSLTLNGRRLVIRMDSWLAYDTIRRAGFGHVIADHQHALAIERGLSFVAWPPGAPTLTAYESSLYAPQPRYVLRRNGE